MILYYGVTTTSSSYVYSNVYPSNFICANMNDYNSSIGTITFNKAYKIIINYTISSSTSGNYNGTTGIYINKNGVNILYKYGNGTTGFIEIDVTKGDTIQLSARSDSYGGHCDGIFSIIVK